jgi:catechol 2,3-dioxygenase-like lactoylglutathione lyase family enzyme
MALEWILEWIRKARGAPLFLGFEHSGLYPLRSDAEAITAWYVRRFGFRKTEEKASYFLSGRGKGRLEIMKSAAGNARVHVAIHVSNFEKAVDDLKAKGVSLNEPMIQPDLKIVYLQDADPEGNLVHLLWSK